LRNDIDQIKIEIEELESGRLYENAFEWRFEFPEVLSDHGDFIGFDVVIGNPPYISIQDLNKTEKTSVDYYRKNFESAQHGNFDIYILFIERINSLTSNSSNSSFILPSKFFTTDYGKSRQDHGAGPQLAMER
jgi:type I restriction-modification system DNA methylase subunit